MVAQKNGIEITGIDSRDVLLKKQEIILNYELTITAQNRLITELQRQVQDLQESQDASNTKSNKETN